MLADYIPQARGRLDAAWDYIQDFKTKSDQFFDSNPYTVITEQEFKGETKILRYRFKVLRQPPQRLREPVTAGLSELRATLNNLVWGLSQILGASCSRLRYRACGLP
jgi:hypothetical protein